MQERNNSILEQIRIQNQQAAIRRQREQQRQEEARKAQQAAASSSSSAENQNDEPKKSDDKNDDRNSGQDNVKIVRNLSQKQIILQLSHNLIMKISKIKATPRVLLLIIIRLITDSTPDYK